VRRQYRQYCRRIQTNNIEKNWAKVSRVFQARIKKIMQSDEDIGKVAAAVPVIISRALELFAETLLKKTYELTTRRNARTLTPSHM
jgi:histone H3/H4